MPGYFDTLSSPVGDLHISVDGEGAVLRVGFVGARETAQPCSDGVHDPDRCAALAGQLGEYFQGRRQRFDLALSPAGTSFQLLVWSEVQAIPYGTTASYGDIARRLGRPGASRAVGRANGHNPIAIVVPCHRVIGSDGSLTGYGGGLEAKTALLALEGALPDPEAQQLRLFPE